MSKSILVIDTPKNCYTCPCGSIVENKFGYTDCECQVTEKEMSEDEFMNKKPDWCPLREMPEKKIRNELIADKEWGCGFASGYNYCIDDILEGVVK